MFLKYIFVLLKIISTLWVKSSLFMPPTSWPWKILGSRCRHTSTTASQITVQQLLQARTTKSSRTHTTGLKWSNVLITSGFPSQKASMVLGYQISWSPAHGFPTQRASTVESISMSLHHNGSVNYYKPFTADVTFMTHFEQTQAVNVYITHLISNYTPAPPKVVIRNQ